MSVTYFPDHNSGTVTTLENLDGVDNVQEAIALAELIMSLGKPPAPPMVRTIYRVSSTDFLRRAKQPDVCPHYLYRCAGVILYAHRRNKNRASVVSVTINKE